VKYVKFNKNFSIVHAFVHYHTIVFVPEEKEFSGNIVLYAHEKNLFLFSSMDKILYTFYTRVALFPRLNL